MFGRTQPEVVVLTKPFCGAPAGAKMLVATPALVKAYLEAIPYGEERSVQQMRTDLAQAHGADVSCPTSSSIFLRIVAEAALEDRSEGMPVSKLPPFWRMVRPETELAKKLSCGPEEVAAFRLAEGLSS